MLRQRRTLTWDRRDVDLVEFALAQREQLVLKPNRSYGGTGVCLGASVDAAEWENRVADALRGADDPHWQSRPLTTSLAACRTSTGRWDRSATFQAIRLATCTRRCCGRSFGATWRMWTMPSRGVSSSR